MTGCATREVLQALIEERLDELIQKETERHIEGCATCQTQLEELTAGPLPKLPGQLPSKQLLQSVLEMASTICLDSSSSEKLDRASHPSEFGAGPLPAIEGYEILTRLGQGGMGIVYKACQIRLNRLVALKMIHPGGDRPEHLARLRLEAEAVAQLRHPNIVAVHDVGEVSGMPYVCLELLEGGSLAERLAHRPQDARMSAEMVATLALAVHEAHRCGIVHRDLKPANVLFSLDGTPKVTDFGLAKRLQVDQGYTETGQVIGSPSYMAPEQAHGNPRSVGPAADIYALGAILYQLLVGRPPFKGESPLETVLQVLHDDPVPPSRITKVPRDLETICLKCLRKEPEDRYSSAHSLAGDLSRFLAGEPVLARPTNLWERSWKWSQRRPGLAGSVIASVIAVFVLCSSIAVQIQQRRIEQSRETHFAYRAEQTLLRAEEACCHQEWMKAELLLQSLESELDGSENLAALRERARQLQVFNSEQQQQARRSRQVKEQFRRFESLRHLALERDAEFVAYNQATHLQETRQAALAALQVYGFENPHGMATIDQLPELLSTEEKLTIREGLAELLFVHAEATFRTLPHESHTEQATKALKILDEISWLGAKSKTLHLRRSKYLAALGRQKAARAEQKKAQQLAITTPFEFFLWGRDLYKRRQFNRAQEAFEHVLQRQPSHFWAQCLLGICLLQEQKPEQSVLAFNACLAKQPQFWPLYLFRGTAYGEQGRLHVDTADKRSLQVAHQFFSFAERDFEKALGFSLGEADRHRILASRGLVRLRAGDLSAAEQDLQQAIALDQSSYLPFRTLAQVHRLQGSFEKAEACLSQAIERNPHLADLFRTRAQYALEKHELTPALRDQAISDLETALRLEPSSGKRTADDFTRWGLLLTRSNRHEEALKACEKALALMPGHTEALRLRVALALELKRFNEIERLVQHAVSRGHATAELYEVRGLARCGTGRRDFKGAIEDFTNALLLKPGSERLLSLRGWAYLFAEAPRMALLDFESALTKDPYLADALCGRGSSFAKLGLFERAKADAETALQNSKGDQRSLYNVARIYLLALKHPVLDQKEDVAVWEERAHRLLSQIGSSLPPAERVAFWRSVIQQDDAIKSLQERDWFKSLAAIFEQKPSQANAQSAKSDNRN